MAPGTVLVGLVSAFSLFVNENPDGLRRAVSWLRPAQSPSVTETERALVPSGSFRPLFTSNTNRPDVKIAAFELDRVPVTNRRFLDFVTAHSEWRRDRVSRLFTGESYLAHWSGPTELGSAAPDQPVTNVSWFSAKAFCESHGLRLPTETEWEYVASASETRADGRKDRDWSARILAWYAKPSRGPDRDAGTGQANFYGIHDLHGLAWEWVFDFNSIAVTSDSRRAGGVEKKTFCGAGAFSSSRPEDYASFMRAAFRSSLEARNTSRHLGFRCAANPKKEEPS